MSSIMIGDLAHNASMDHRAMATVRGGGAFGTGVNVNVNLNQQIAQFQNIGVNVLNNNGSVGGGFTAPSISLSPEQWAKNEAVLPRF